MLPPSFWETQYRFADGQVVDAVIRLRGHLVPVDAKFPLESFQRMVAAEDDVARKAARKEFERSVKGRIDEIADKYIRPGEGTFEFALMFIPAENIYYEVIIKDDSLGEGASLLAYATSRRVVPVSPNSFYAYLSTIVTGLKGMQVERGRARSWTSSASCSGSLGASATRSASSAPTWRTLSASTRRPTGSRPRSATASRPSPVGRSRVSSQAPMRRPSPRRHEASTGRVAVKGKTWKVKGKTSNTVAV